MKIFVLDDNCEIISVPLCKEIDEKNDSEVLMCLLGDEAFSQKYGRNPLKKEESRRVLAKSIKGVSYVWVVGDPEVEECKETQCLKRYKVGYVPGTFDLLHPGHLEIIQIAKMNCEKVIVGVNSDELAFKNKGKRPAQNANTRKYILEHIKGVDGVIIIDTNDKNVANHKVEELIGERFEAIFFGQDLKCKAINDEGSFGITSVYTDRSTEKMENVSSTRERKKLEQLSKENSNLLEECQTLKRENSELTETLKKFYMQVDE